MAIWVGRVPPDFSVYQALLLFSSPLSPEKGLREWIIKKQGKPVLLNSYFRV